MVAKDQVATSLHFGQGPQSCDTCFHVVGCPFSLRWTPIIALAGPWLCPSWFDSGCGHVEKDMHSSILNSVTCCMYVFSYVCFVIFELHRPHSDFNSA